jgi:hypothetical protein
MLAVASRFTSRPVRRAHTARLPVRRPHRQRVLPRVALRRCPRRPVSQPPYPPLFYLFPLLTEPLRKPLPPPRILSRAVSRQVPIPIVTAASPPVTRLR